MSSSFSQHDARCVSRTVFVLRRFPISFVKVVRYKFTRSHETSEAGLANLRDIPESTRSTPAAQLQEVLLL